MPIYILQQSRCRSKRVVPHPRVRPRPACCPYGTVSEGSRQTAHLTGGFIQTSQISARTWYTQNARPFRPGAHVTSFLTSLARIFPYAPARVLILYRVVPGGQGHRVAVGSCEPMSFRIRLIIPRLGGYLAMKCLLVLVPATTHTLLM